MIFGRCVKPCARPWILEKKVIILNKWYRSGYLWQLAGLPPGAKEIMNYFIEALDREKVDALVTQTGCMGYCYAEPTVEVTLPGKEPLVFGHVKKAKVDEIIDLYIRNGELLDDIIPVTYTVVKPE